MNRIQTKQLYAAIISFLLLLSGCQTKSSQQEEVVEDSGIDKISFSDEQAELAGIQVGKLEEKLLSEDVSCNGSIEIPPQSMVSISIPMDGYVKKIDIYSGTKVKKGDLLAVMQHPDFLNLQQEYLVTSNNLEMLKKDLERQEILAKEDAASEKKLMAASTDYKNTLVRHKYLAEQLKMLGIDPGGINVNKLSSEVKVLSPINGYVRRNFANTGELMHAGDPILELEDNSHLHVHLIVYEKDINLIREGQKVEFRTGTGQKQYYGSINTVGKTINDDTRSADVHVHISNQDASLLSGMYITARILVQETQVYALPESGIATESGQNYIFARDGNSFRRIPVKTGIIRDGYVEIKAPEPFLDKEIVIAGAYYLNAGFGEE